MLINIFGGLRRRDTLADGVIQAVREVQVKAPAIIRLEGTNVEAGRQVLGESGLTFTVATDMRDAARKVASLVQ